jgi:predicted N-acetyltransferase YhbS
MTVTLAIRAPVSLLPDLVAETPADAAEIEALIDAAFGPGRFVKAAERLREGRAPLFDLSFVARERGRLVGCVRQWAIRIGDTPSILLGPFAVDPAYRSRGLGAALITRACEAAEHAGHASILLVGDRPYFEPLRFEPVAPGRIRLPGPVDANRILVRALRPGGTASLEGEVRAAG